VHTRLVCKALVRDPAWRALPAAEREVLFAAAVLHDVGKPETTTLEADGRITSRGHARAGALRARRLLWEFGVPFVAREAVVALVRWHMRPGLLVDRADAVRQLLEVSMTARCDWLALLARADPRGREGGDPARALLAVDCFEALAEEWECLTGPFPFANPQSRVEYFRADRDPAGVPIRDPRYAAHVPRDQAEVVLMAGAPGSGKSRWLRRERPALPVFGLDALRRDPATPRGLSNSELSGLALERYVKPRLRAREPFAWDATSLIRDLRGRVIGTAVKYGARVHGVYVEVPADVLWRQNAGRPASEVVPEDVIATRYLDRWDIPDLTEVHEMTYAVTEAETVSGASVVGGG
jgi:predicted kinase